MDLPTLKSLPLRLPLPVVNAVSGLLVSPGTSRHLQYGLAKTISENIFTIGSTIDESKIPAKEQLVLLPPLHKNFKDLVSELFYGLHSTERDQKLSLFYERSFPLSVVVEKLGQHLSQGEIPGKDSSINLSALPSLMIEGLSNSFSRNLIPQNMFQTTLPLSTLKGFTPRQKSRQATKHALPTRLPYETKKESKKLSFLLQSFFERYLRKSKPN